MSDDQTPDPIEGDNNPDDSLVEDTPAQGDQDSMSPKRQEQNRNKVQGSKKQQTPSSKPGGSSPTAGKGQSMPSSSSLNPGNQDLGNKAKEIGKKLKDHAKSSDANPQDTSGKTMQQQKQQAQDTSGETMQQQKQQAQQAMNATGEGLDTGLAATEAVGSGGSSLLKRYGQDALKGIAELRKGDLIAAAKKGTKKIRQDLKVIFIAIFAAFTVYLIFILIIVGIFVAIFGGNAAASATQQADKYLTVTKTSNPAEVANGQQFSYTITIVAQAGAGDVSVSDALPTQVQYVSSTGGSTVQNGFVVWTAQANHLTPPFTTSFTITVKPIVNDTYAVNAALGHVDNTQTTNPSCGQKMTPPTGPAPGFSCTGPWGTQPMQDKFYYATSFGCSTIFGPDPGDNCIPGCAVSKIPECQSTYAGGRACEELVKWYAADSGRFGCGALLKITNPLTGKAVVVRAIDAGPACWVENNVNRGIVDMSKDAANALFGTPDSGWADRRSIYVEPIPAGSAPLGPVAACP